MRRLGFRLRLALLFVATLLVVQVLTAALIYEVSRRALIVEGEHQLAATADAFVAQMDDLSARVADNVEILSLDYALRSAIAERDQGTVLSVLRNHGRRVGASRMLLVGLDGKVQADTRPAGHALQRFPFPDLIRSAYVRRTAAVVALEGKANWMVAVPIYAPQPIGLVVVSIPLDDALLAHMQHLSALPRNIELAVRDARGSWSVVARGDPHSRLTRSFMRNHRELPLKPVLAQVDGREFMLLSQRLQQPQGSQPVVAVLGYSLDDALRPFRFVAMAWAVLLALGLGVGLIGAWLTARSVARPIEALAVSARRIGAGDYSAPAAMQRNDEIGQLAAAFGTMTDAVRQREERIRHQALHDAVTDLPNRQAAESSIDLALAQGAPGGALLMIGLTRVPDIVKTMGHALCDRLLRDAGQRIRGVCAGALLARATDSQFVVWLPGATREAAATAARRILGIFRTPYQEPDAAVDALPSIGIALTRGTDTPSSTLLRRAEVAQFAASGSADAMAFYDPSTDPHRPERLSLMGELREALDAGALMLHYQPKLAIATRRIDSVEALIRWNHPRRGVIQPDAFIGMAEDTGNIQRVSRWVLGTAIAQARQWMAQGSPLRVAANLSARDLEDVDLPQRIVDLLATQQVPPQCLTVEVTERAVIGEPEQAVALLDRLAAHGIGIAIDDFGVGQSSFAYLRRLPISELKVDQTFVRQLATDRNDQIIVRSIVELAHRLGYEVTAEGVEDAGSLEYLASIGCDHAQGYLVARPMPAAALGALLGPGAVALP